MTNDAGLEARRHDLYTWAQGAMGPQNAHTLMELLPPTGWGDVAQRSDVTALRSDVDALRSDVDALRSDVDALRSDVDALRSDVDALRSDVDALRSHVEREFISVRAEITTLRHDMEREFASLRREIDIRLDAMEERITARVEQKIDQLRSEMHNTLRMQLFAVMGMVGTLWIGGLGIAAGMS